LDPYLRTPAFEALLSECGELRRRIDALLKAAGEADACNCGAAIFWINQVRYDPDGRTHDLTCPLAHLRREK